MKSILAFGLACLSASAALAQNRPSTTDMPCARAAALVRSQGAIVLGTGGYTYDRFVSGPNSCVYSEAIEPAYVPSADNPQCAVGYRCRSRSRNNN